MTMLTSPVPLGRPSFLDALRCVELDRLEADVTVLGVPFTTPHDLASSRAPASAAPAALREQSRRYTGQTCHHDFDLGGPLFGGRRIRLVDAGDVCAVPGRYADNAQRAVAALEAVVQRGGLNARPADVEDARRGGSVLVRAEEVHEAGVSTVLRRLPSAPCYVLCVDAAALDPAVAPGVETPAFGGLTYFEVTNLLRGIAARGPVAGLALTGIVPDRDLHDMTSLLGARLILTLIGALAHAGRLGTTDGARAVTAGGIRPAVPKTRVVATAGARQ